MSGFNMFSDIFGDIREDVNMHYQNEYNRHQTSKAYRRQKEFAQKQIRWSAADAKAAGLHPLYAMGSGTAQHSAPQHVGAVRGSNSSNSLPQSTTSAAQERLTRLRGDYVEEQILASRQARENQGNNGTSELIEETDSRAITQMPRQATPHKTHQKPGGYVDPDGRKMEAVVPRGSPNAIMQEELGELAEYTPDNFKRWWKFMQNTNQLPSKRDIKALKQDFIRWVRKHKPKRAKAAKKRRYPRSYR